MLAERHVSRAALRLHRSQPAVSHALAQLRSLFNDPLLVRRGGHLELTARARELAQPLEQALGQLGELLAPAAFVPAQARRSFRLAMSDYGSRVVLPALARRLREAAPGMDLVVSQASREAMVTQLLDGEVDLALGVFPSLPQELATEALFQESFCCLADRSSLPADGELSLDAWLARPHVLVAMRPGADNEIDLALAVLGKRRRVAIMLPHWSAANELVGGTDLILTVARRSLDHAGVDPRLRCFEPPFAIPSFTFQQAWHARREVDPAHRWLRNEVRAACVQATEQADH
ncbi:HTH-type transcriptional regulator SyrM 1 [compost metagenome]